MPGVFYLKLVGTVPFSFTNPSCYEFVAGSGAEKIEVLEKERNAHSYLDAVRGVGIILTLLAVTSAPFGATRRVSTRSDLMPSLRGYVPCYVEASPVHR